MTKVELLILLAWLLAPPLLLGWMLMLYVLKKAGWPARHAFTSCFILPLFSGALAFLMAAFGPSGWGAVIGVKDHPLPWAPFAFIAVGLALPLTLWLVGLARGRSSS